MNVVKIRNICELFCIIQNNLSIEGSMTIQNSLKVFLTVKKCFNCLMILTEFSIETYYVR